MHKVRMLEQLPLVGSPVHRALASLGNDGTPFTKDELCDRAALSSSMARKVVAELQLEGYVEPRFVLTELGKMAAKLAAKHEHLKPVSQYIGRARPPRP